jgi:hypothetical protein
MTTRNPGDEGFDLDTYRKDMVRALLQEIFTLVSAHEKTHGKEFATQMVVDLLGSYVSTCVYNALVSPLRTLATTDEDKIAEAGRTAYGDMKGLIESAVGQGFETAFHAFNPKVYPDFQCDVMPIAEGKDVGKNN